MPRDTQPVELPLEARALTELEVMEALSVSRNTVRALRVSGELPSFNIGRTVRYPATAVVRFLANRSRRSPGDGEDA